MLFSNNCYLLDSLLWGSTVGCSLASSCSTCGRTFIGSKNH